MSDAPPHPLRRPLAAVAKLVLSVGLMAFVLRDTSLAALWQMFRRVQPSWILAAMSMHGLVLALSVWRWHVLLGAQHVRVPVRTLAESFWVALFFNNFLPSNIGGDFVRIADTASAAGSRTVATAVVLLDRVLGLIALFAVAACGSLLLRHTLPGTGYLWVLLIGGALAAAIVVSQPALVTRGLRPLARLREDWVTERLGRLETMLSKAGGDYASLLQAFGGALVVQGLVVLFYLCVAKGLHIDLPLRDAMVIVPVSLVIQLAPVSINGFGVREAVFSYLFRMLGHPVDAGLALSIAGAALLILASLPGGLIFLLRKEGLMTPPPSSDMPEEEV
jgi:uncharacterized membrane protein YbhN (UPF0104 family)